MFLIDAPVIDAPVIGAQDLLVLVSYSDLVLGAPEPYLILILAFLIDAIVGDPYWIYRRIPHPVAIVGELIGCLEKRLNKPNATERAKYFSGILAVVLVVASAVIFGWLIGYGLRAISIDWIWMVEAVLVAVLVANRDLFDHVRHVAVGLDADLSAGRNAVAHIVGRDPETLDEAGVARAAIESVAENFSDGVVAPVLYYVLFGLPGILAYKAVNTLDSMVGHRNERYRSFGWAAARLDDLVNLPASRLAGGLIVLAAYFLPGVYGSDAAVTMRRDARKHRSPNAGWPEAAMAGALSVALAGPRVYESCHVEDHWMGSGRQDVRPQDIRRALRVYVLAGILCAALGVLILAI